MLVSRLGLPKLSSDSEYIKANSGNETKLSEKGGKSKKKKKVAVSGVSSLISLLYDIDERNIFR